MDYLDAIAEELQELGIDVSFDDGEDGVEFLDADAEPVLGFDLRLDPAHGTAIIKNFSVGPDYKGRGISVMALQHIAEMCVEEEIDNLELDHVVGDGMTFWPKYGAHPKNLDELPLLIEHMLHQGSYEDAQGTLSDLFDMAADDAQDAWYEMTRDEAEMDESCVMLINRVLSDDRTMVMDLTRTEVLERLGL